jgi:hypothetical protein
MPSQAPPPPRPRWSWSSFPCWFRNPRSRAEGFLFLSGVLGFLFLFLFACVAPTLQLLGGQGEVGGMGSRLCSSAELLFASDSSLAANGANAQVGLKLWRVSCDLDLRPGLLQLFVI